MSDHKILYEWSEAQIFVLWAITKYYMSDQKLKFSAYEWSQNMVWAITKYHMSDQKLKFDDKNIPSECSQICFERS